ncbi:MAG: DedA family protein [Herpetosiphonaceae bacterium]|nr:MAG: DedA family protein [Herpetosiphonaceae bacterium]
MLGLIMSYAGLFLWSFLAATILPLSSEAPLAALVYTQRQIVLPVLVATAGNYLGACTTYWIGRQVAVARRRQHSGQDDTRTRRASLALLQRYGQPALLLSWVPLLGDALVAVAGLMHVPFGAFSLWVVSGKVIRYLAVAWAAAALL